MNTTRYNHSFDAHVAAWGRHTFGLTIQRDEGRGWNVWEGDYDLDAYCVMGERTVIVALREFFCGIGADEFDALCAIEAGEVR